MYMVPTLFQEHSQGTTPSSSTPSSKRNLEDFNEIGENSSTTKKLCLDSIDLEDQKKGDLGNSMVNVNGNGNKSVTPINNGVKIKIEGVKK